MARLRSSSGPGTPFPLTLPPLPNNPFPSGLPPAEQDPETWFQKKLVLKVGVWDEPRPGAHGTPEAPLPPPEGRGLAGPRMAAVPAAGERQLSWKPQPRVEAGPMKELLRLEFSRPCKGVYGRVQTMPQNIIHPLSNRRVNIPRPP